MTEPRHGDVVLVKAEVVQATRDSKLTVHFKNGDQLPLSSVIVHDIIKAQILKGDRVRNKYGQVDVYGIVKAIFIDMDPPQVAYKLDNEWCLRVAKLEDLIRL